MGGGMGGGSSDAAAALQGLNRLWNLNWPRERLHAIAAKLGSDVAYFLYGGWCRCRGRGEIVEPLQASVFPTVKLLLLFPGLQVPTPAVYKSMHYPPWDGKSGLRSLTVLNQSIDCDHQDMLRYDGVPKCLLRNDLTKFARTVEPGLIPLQAALEVIAPGRWLMSGSGATHFVVLREREEGPQLGELLRAEVGSNLRVLTTTTCHP